MKSFELFLQKDKISASDWVSLTQKIAKYDKNFAFEVNFGSNIVEFFLHSNKDLSCLGAELREFIIKPAEKRPSKERPTITIYRQIRFKLSGGKNILEIKEAEEMKKQRIINRVAVQVRKIALFTFFEVEVFLQDEKGNHFYSSYHSFINPLVIFEFNFSKNSQIKKKSPPIFLKIDQALELFNSSKPESFLMVSGFPYFSTPVYFSLKNFDFAKHTLLVGQTGVGKSKLIELFIRNIAKSPQKGEYVIVLIDPHAGLYPQLLNLGENKINFDFIRSSCELFPAFSQAKIATELLILLFKSLLKEQFNAKLERVLKYTLFILFAKNQMTLENLKRFLSELEFRREILAKPEEDEFDYLFHFFETEFVELQTKFYEIAIMPILVLIDELSFIPAFSRSVPAENLESALKQNFLICFSLNRIFLGEKATKLIAGLIAQQLFLIAQKRSCPKKIIFIIDEVSLVENESLTSILGEARKFDLSLVLSQQYLTQTSPELLKAIFANVFNYFVFKISDEDAELVAQNLEIAIPGEILKKKKAEGFSEKDIKRGFLVNLNPRECLVRVFSGGKFYPCFKAETMEASL